MDNFVTLKLRVEDPYTIIKRAVRSGLCGGLNRFMKHSEEHTMTIESHKGDIDDFGLHDNSDQALLFDKQTEYIMNNIYENVIDPEEEE